MDKCYGVELCHVWDNISDAQKATIIQQLVKYETAFATAAFPAYGSLYYTKDLTNIDNIHQVVVPSSQSPSSTSFSMGPTTDRNYFDHGRSEVATDRGPCK